MKQESITLICPYIRTAQLMKVNNLGKISQIVIRWQIHDIIQGSSDLELYEYCLENGITLYRNTKIHLKAFWNNKDSVLFGSANVTGRGIGEEGNYNYELNGICNDMTFNDRLYLQNIIVESELVDQTLFDKIKGIVTETPKPSIEYPTLESKKKEIDYFLLSQLPMSETPQRLFEVVQNPSNYTEEDQKFALHDLAIFNISSSENREEFINTLKDKFNSHFFILTLKAYIKSQATQSLSYGGVVRWIQNNTTTVPTPRSWELKQQQIVNILYEWICEFDEGFSWGRPNYSQVIKYVK